MGERERGRERLERWRKGERVREGVGDGGERDEGVIQGGENQGGLQ